MQKTKKPQVDSSEPKEVVESKELETTTELGVLQPAEIKDGQLILTEKQKELIKSQIAPTATKDELDLFFMMAYRTKLDPLLKQLYFIKFNNSQGPTVSYVTSIDGYRIIAHRTNDFAGIDEPEYKYDQNRKVTHCTIRVYRKSSERPFSATVKFSEYTTGKNMWVSKPETMIAKVAEAHALRKAFPQDLSGIYTTDEMEQSTHQPEIVQKTSQNQADKIKQLMGDKGISVDVLREFVEKTYRRHSLKELTKTQANEVIKYLEKQQNFIELDEVEENQDFEIPEPEQPNQPMPENDNISDDVADALEIDKLADAQQRLRQMAGEPV